MTSNYLSNANKFTRKGEIEVQVFTGLKDSKHSLSV